MRFAAILSSIAVVLSLDTILLLAAVVPDLQSIRPLVNGLVMVIDLSLITSSGLLGFLLYKKRHRRLAAIFSLNILILALAYILGFSGVRLPLPILYAADLYWLNLYLVCLSSKFSVWSSYDS